jgi:cyanophycinase-like exopeptidase
MPGIVCLQGGGELSPGCRDMDLALLARAPGPVAVVALASPQGEVYRRTCSHGVSWFRRLGAEAFAVPDPREEPLGATLDGVGLVVLPGGSPSTLMDALEKTGFGAALVDHVTAGGAVMGASAGAMALGEWTVLPDAGFRVVPGLGLAPRVAVVPHWDGPRADWLKTLDREVDKGLIIGIPEESGILLEKGRLTGLGQRPSCLVREDREVGVGRTIRRP